MKKRTKDFSGFSVSITKDSRRKKRLSNNVEITFRSDTSEVSQRMTIRQARALQAFLSKQIGMSEQQSSSEG